MSKFNDIANSIIGEEAGQYSIAKTGDVMFKLKAISEDFSSDPVKQTFANIATRTLSLLEGVDRFSKRPPRLSPQQLKAAHDIGEIVTAVYGPLENPDEE